MSQTLAYDEVIDFIAAGSSPDAVAAFRPSDTARARVADLLTREKQGALTADEARELGHAAQLEHIMRLAEARAHRLLLADQGTAPA